MKLYGRIGRLERTAESRPPVPCPVCGAPAGWVPAMSVKNPQGVELLPTCSQ